MSDRLTRIVDRVLRVRRETRESRSRRSVAAFVAAAAFVVGGVLAATRLDVGFDDIRWGLLVVVAVVGVPLTAAVNALEYVVSARALGTRVSPGEALRVSVLGTAANLLPLPGSTLIRIRALRDGGSEYGRATKITAAIGIEWIAVSALLAGGWLLATARTPGWWFLFGGVLAQGLAVFLVRWASPSPEIVVRTTTEVVVVEVAVVLVSALRVALVLAALGVGDPAGAALALTVGAALAGAAGIFPGGLGLREVLSALLAPLAGVAAAAGFAASALNRLIGVAVHAPIAVGLALNRNDRAAE